MRGYFGIGIFHGKNTLNYGTLFRSANILGADFIFLIGKRFKKQSSDTTKSHRHLPLFEYGTFEHFYSSLPYGCQLVGVEMCDSSRYLSGFTHPEQAVYLLGAEDHGLPDEVIKKCHRKVRLFGERSLNVAVAGSIVIHDRISKTIIKLEGQLK